MKNLKMFLMVAVLALVLIPPPSEAQTVTLRTTLTNAVTSTNGGTILLTVGSTTGMTASGTSTSATSNTGGQTFLLIDAELDIVVSVPTSTTVTVRRGGVISQHAASAEVRWAPGGYIWNPNSGNASGAFVGTSAVPPSGACTRGNNQFLPVFRVDPAGSGIVYAYDCPNNVSASTGTWIQWQYYPPTSQVAERTPVPTASTAYTALPADYLIAVPSVITNNTTVTITLPCSSVPAGKIWIIGDEGGKVGTTGAGISIVGNPGAVMDTQQILAGFTSKAFRSNGTNCFRLF